MVLFGIRTLTFLGRGAVLGVEFRAFHLLGRALPLESYPQLQDSFMLLKIIRDPKEHLLYVSRDKITINLKILIDLFVSHQSSNTSFCQIQRVFQWAEQRKLALDTGKGWKKQKRRTESRLLPSKLLGLWKLEQRGFLAKLKLLHLGIWRFSLS
jgi:hypothetical protein